MLSNDSLATGWSVGIYALCVAAVLTLSGCGKDAPARAPSSSGRPSSPLAGEYVLDQVDFAKGLLKQGTKWTESTAESPELAAAQLSSVRAEAKRRAAETSFRLVVADGGTFQMHIEQKGADRIVGYGTWVREGTKLTLETTRVDMGSKAPDDEPLPPEDAPKAPEPPMPPPMIALIQGDVLVMQAGEGVPFEHRLVRK